MLRREIHIISNGISTKVDETDLCRIWTLISSFAFSTDICISNWYIYSFWNLNHWNEHCHWLDLFETFQKIFLLHFMACDLSTFSFIRLYKSYESTQGICYFDIENFMKSTLKVSDNFSQMWRDIFALGIDLFSLQSFCSYACSSLVISVPLLHNLMVKNDCWFKSLEGMNFFLINKYRPILELVPYIFVLMSQM